jgi:hypothetical protein
MYNEAIGLRDELLGEAMGADPSAAVSVDNKDEKLPNKGNKARFG